jgi:hypothetical protein
MDAVRIDGLTAFVFTRLATSYILFTLRLLELTKVNALAKFHLILTEFGVSLLVGLN